MLHPVLADWLSFYFLGLLLTLGHAENSYLAVCGLMIIYFVKQMFYTPFFLPMYLFRVRKTTKFVFDTTMDQFFSYSLILYYCFLFL